jgi:hypothetical protein
MVARGAYQIYQGVQRILNERAPVSQPHEYHPVVTVW